MPAEDSYYELLPKPYHRKNAAFDNLEELRRVRGISDEFWDTFVDPDPEHPKKREFTVWGASNAINVNTAEPVTMINLVCGAAAEPLPRMAPGQPAEQLAAFELTLVDMLCAQATAETARDVADKTWDLVHDRKDEDPVKRRVVECHEALARLSARGSGSGF